MTTPAVEVPEGFWYQHPLDCEWQRREKAVGQWAFATFETPTPPGTTDPAVDLRPNWKTTYRVTVWEVRTDDAAQCEAGPLAADDPASAFLDPQAPDVAWVLQQCPEFEQVAESLFAQPGSAWERAKRTWDYVAANHSEFGKCYLRSSLFCGLLRRQGVPARLIGGLCSRAWAHHVWAEYYLPGYGWAPVDWIPGSGFDIVSAKHLAFWRGSPPPRPASRQAMPVNRPVVCGQKVDSSTPLSVEHRVTCTSVVAATSPERAAFSLRPY